MIEETLSESVRFRTDRVNDSPSRRVLYEGNEEAVTGHGSGMKETNDFTMDKLQKSR